MHTHRRICILQATNKELNEKLKEYSEMHPTQVQYMHAHILVRS